MHKPTDRTNIELSLSFTNEEHKVKESVQICSGAGEGRVSAQAAAGDADAARAQDPDGAGQEPRRRAHGRGRRELEMGTKTVREGIENCDLKTLGANCHNFRMDLKVVTCNSICR